VTCSSGFAQRRSFDDRDRHADSYPDIPTVRKAVHGNTEAPSLFITHRPLTEESPLHASRRLTCVRGPHHARGTLMFFSTSGASRFASTPLKFFSYNDTCWISQFPIEVPDNHKQFKGGTTPFHFVSCALHTKTATVFAVDSPADCKEVADNRHPLAGIFIITKPLSG
jgi:hypothetical protein